MSLFLIGYIIDPNLSFPWIKEFNVLKTIAFVTAQKLWWYRNKQAAVY